MAAESPWDFLPAEILSHIFSFLPARGRNLSSTVCRNWALTVSNSSVWRFTEIGFEDDSLEVSQAMLVTFLPYMKHIRSLKIEIDQTRGANQKSACNLFDALGKHKCQLQALRVVCTGSSPFFYSGQDVLQSVRRFCRQMGTVKLQAMDLRQMPFALDNMTVGLIAKCSPDLHTLLINNRAPGVVMVLPETVADVLSICPNLSTLGVAYVSLSVAVFKVLLDPDRQPFKYLDLYYNDLYPCIPHGVWTAMLQRHPCFQVGLEFTTEVHPTKMAQILNPFIPVAALRFSNFSCLVDHLMLAARYYSQTLEVLELLTAASDNLNAALIELAKRCSRLREVHCSCPVSSEVESAFLCDCPNLRKYTLSTVRWFSSTVYL